MAIFKTGALIGGISGSVGGANFVNTRGSGVVRKTRLSTPGCTEAQLLKQAQLQRSILRWRNMSEENKKLWNNAALTISFPNRLGVKTLLSGYQYFLRSQSFGEVDFPPSGLVTRSPVTVQFFSSITLGIRVQTSSPPPVASLEARISAMPLFRSTPIKFQNFYKTLGGLVGVQNAIHNISNLWDPIFARPQLGQFVALRYEVIISRVPTSETIDQIIETTA